MFVCVKAYGELPSVCVPYCRLSQLQMSCSEDIAVRLLMLSSGYMDTFRVVHSDVELAALTYELLSMHSLLRGNAALRSVQCPMLSVGMFVQHCAKTYLRDFTYEDNLS